MHARVKRVRDKALGVTACIAAASALAIPATAAAAASCRAKASTTIVRNALARVYVQVRRGAKRHYLCTYRSGRKLLLDPPAEGVDIDEVDRFRLNGRFLAYQRTHVYFRAGTSFTIEVRDVRTRRRTRSVNATPDEGGSMSSPGDGVRDLVVTRRAALAWIAKNPYAAGPRLQVRRADTTGETLLDSGDEIAPSSLKLSGSTVRWRNGSEEKSAQLDD